MNVNAHGDAVRWLMNKDRSQAWGSTRVSVPL
jgi:hypothetical protein